MNGWMGSFDLVDDLHSHVHLTPQRPLLPPNTPSGTRIIYTWNIMGDYLCRRKLPTRRFRPSTKSFGRLELAAALLLRCRTKMAGDPGSLLPSLSPRGRWGTISYSPRLSRTDWDRATPSLARRSLSMEKPGSPFPLRSSGWYFYDSHQHAVRYGGHHQIAGTGCVGRADEKKDNGKKQKRKRLTTPGHCL